MNDVVAQIGLAASGPGVIDYPDGWTDAYTHDDQKRVLQVIDWLNATQGHPREAERWSQARLAKAAGVKTPTLNAVLRGKYPSSPSAWLDACLDAIARQTYRDTEQVRPAPFVETSVVRRVTAICHRAHVYHSFGVVSGAVGIGKTLALRRYQQEHHNVYYVYGIHRMTKSVFLNELMDQADAVLQKGGKRSGGTEADRLVAVAEAIRGQDALIILDEADKVTEGVLWVLKDLREMVNVGAVFAGNEGLKPLLLKRHGKFDQIGSRTNFRPPVMNAITGEDAVRITRAALEAHGAEVDDATAQAFWEACEGSARVLAENLIPAVRDYGLRKGLALTPDLVLKVSGEVLGWQPGRAAQGGAR